MFRKNLDLDFEYQEIKKMDLLSFQQQLRELQRAEAEIKLKMNALKQEIESRKSELALLETKQEIYKKLVKEKTMRLQNYHRRLSKKLNRHEQKA